MRTFVALALASAFATIAPSDAAADVRVVATIADLAAIAAEIGGEHVDVEALASPRQDPHYVDARPSYIVALNRADLLLVAGLELEIGWLPPLQTQARNPRINAGQPGYLDASEHIDRLGVPTGRVTRAMGDIHTGGNPHFLLAPTRAIQVAEAVRDRLVQLDPEHESAYRASTDRFVAELQAFAEDQAARFGQLPVEQRRVVPYHESMVYLTEWLGLEAVEHIEPVPGTPPSPGHVAEVLGTMRSTGASVLIQEEFYPTNTAETLAQMVQGELVVIHGGTRFSDGQRYVDHLREIVEPLHEALASGGGQ